MRQRHAAAVMVASALLAGAVARGADEPEPAAEARAAVADDLLACEREQHRIASMTATVARTTLDLLKTMRANRAADAPTVERWERTVRELTTLSQQHMARVVTSLRRARRDGSARSVSLDHLRDASVEQREILSRLLALLRTIEKRVAFARVVDALEQLIKDQRRARDQTVATARETLGKSPDALSDAERQRLADLKDEQDVMREAYKRLGDSLETLKKGAAESEPRQAAAARQAARRMDADRADRDMRRAADALAERKPVDAAAAQTKALDKLRRLHDLLSRDDSTRLRTLERAADALDRLMREQRDVKRRTAQTKPDAPDEAVRDLLKAQSRLADATDELADSTKSASPKASAALAEAGKRQRAADARLAARKPADAAGEQQAALDRMQAAKAALEAGRDELARRLAEPGPARKLEKAAKDLDRVIKGQQAAARAAGKMADDAKAGKAPDQRELNRAAAEQRDLAADTRRLDKDLGAEAGDDTTRTLNAALKEQDDAAKKLEGKQPDHAAEAQKRAVAALKKAAGNLRYQLKLAKEAAARAEALARLDAQREEAVDALGKAARRLDDLDRVIAEQAGLKDAADKLAGRIKGADGKKPIPKKDARREADELAEKQRALKEQTGGLADLMGDLDRDTAKGLDDATGPQHEAAGRLDEAKPREAVPHQAKALGHLKGARGHLAGKLGDIVALLKKLEARRDQLAKGRPGEEEPKPPEKPGGKEASIDDLLKLASALVDIDRLKGEQQTTRAATVAEAGKAEKPDKAALGKLTRTQDTHAKHADELAKRMGRFDADNRLGTAEMQNGVRDAGDAMRDASRRLTEAKAEPAAADQATALARLDVALAAARRAVAEVAKKAQQQMQQQQQNATDPNEYDPNNRPPGEVKPEDLVRVARWNINLPPRIRDEIIAALSDRFPAGYEDLLRRYYEDLSQEAWEQLNLRRWER